MKWFVYYNFGSCNYGDHETNLEEFDTPEEAQKRASDLVDQFGFGLEITIIEGKVLA